VVMPAFLVFEALGPVVELSGYIVTVHGMVVAEGDEVRNGSNRSLTRWGIDKGMAM